MKDRASNQPGRVLLRKDGTSISERYFMTIDDDPSVVGTPLNKANILTDQTETDLFGEPLDKTPNQAFEYIANHMLRSPEDKSYKAVFDTDHPYLNKDDGTGSLSVKTIGETLHYIVYLFNDGTMKTYDKSTLALKNTYSAPSDFSSWYSGECLMTCSKNDVFSVYYQTTTSGTTKYVLCDAVSSTRNFANSNAKLIGGNANYSVIFNSTVVNSYRRDYYRVFANSDILNPIQNSEGETYFVYYYEKEDADNNGQTRGTPDNTFVILSGDNDLYLGREIYHWGQNTIQTNYAYVIHLGATPSRERVSFSNTGSPTVWPADETLVDGKFIYLWHDPTTSVNRLYAVMNSRYLVYIDFRTKVAGVLNDRFNTSYYPARYIGHVYDDTMNVVVLLMRSSTDPVHLQKPVLILNMNNMGGTEISYSGHNNKTIDLPFTLMDKTIKRLLPDGLIACGKKLFITKPSRQNLSITIVPLYRVSVGSAAQNFAFQYEQVTGTMLQSGGCSIQTSDQTSDASNVIAGYYPTLTAKCLMKRVLGFVEV